MTRCACGCQQHGLECDRAPPLTPPELAAWLSGRDAAAVAARAMARRIRAAARGCPTAFANAATLETHADALAEMEPPA